jgi:hypothetical protein
MSVLWLVTINGVNFLDPGQCSTNPRITYVIYHHVTFAPCECYDCMDRFDYGNGVAPVCTLLYFRTAMIICLMPAGQGKPNIIVNICGQVQRALPTYVPSSPSTLPACHSHRIIHTNGSVNAANVKGAE